MKKDEITEESPFSDTIQNITSSTEFMVSDPLEVVGALVKKEATTEESPFSDKIQNTTSTTDFMDPLEVVVAQVKTEKIEEDEQSTIKEEPA